MVSKDEDYIDNDYCACNLRLFRLIGLCEYHPSPKQLIYTCFIKIILAIALFPQIYMLFTSERNINMITKSLETTLPALCFVFCYCNLLLKAAIIKKILDHIKHDWLDLKDKPEIIILQKHANVSRQSTIIIAISFYLYIVLLIFPSLLRIFQYIFGVISETELILPVRADYFMKNQLFYFSALLYEYIGMCIVCMVGVANYSMFIAVIQHACALFNILEWRVNDKFKKRSSHDNCRAFTHKEENEWIIDTIEFYNNAINFVNLIKLFYETIYIFEGFFASIFIIVDYIYLFQVLSFTLNTSEIITKFCYVIGSLLVIYAYFNLGQKLIDQNTDLFIQLCQIPFYSLSLKTQKILLLLIMKSMRSCNLSVKGLVVVSHYTFAKLMQSSFSFAMIFFNLQ